MTGARFLIYAMAVHEPGRPRSTTAAWRLLAGNNRPLGRSPRDFTDVAACRAAIRELQDGLSTAWLGTSGSGRAAWRWELRLGGELAAGSVRVYTRQLEAQAAQALFLQLAATAIIAVADHQVMSFSRASGQIRPIRR